MDVKVAVQDVQILAQVLVRHVVHLTVQEIVHQAVKDAHYHAQQVAVSIILEAVDQVALAAAALIAEQDVKDVVVQQHQIDIIVIYLMNMQ